MKKKNSETTAISLLESQHREVEELFEKFEEASEDEDDSETAFTIASEVCFKLTCHATIEEEIFYPGVDNEDTHELLQEAAVEHTSAKRLIADIQGQSEGGEQLKALMSVLQEQISHHVEEEEGTLFPQVSESMEEEELASLAERMEERFAELQAAGTPEDGAKKAKVGVAAKKTSSRRGQSHA